MRDADEVLLRSVVEVPLEALPFRVARGDDPRARLPDLFLHALAGSDVEPAQQVPEAPFRIVDDGRGPVDDEAFTVHTDVLVLDDSRCVAVPEPGEVLLGAFDVLLGDEDSPERSVQPRLLRDAGRPLERAVDAEQRPVRVDEREEARRRADDRAAEVALAFELAGLPCPVGEVADDEDELVGPAGHGPALVVAHLTVHFQ